jgi:hypothetical protein
LKLKALLLEVLVLASGVGFSNPQEHEWFDLWWSGSSRNWTSLPIIIFLYVKFPFAVHHIMHRSREWNVLKSSFLFCLQIHTSIQRLWNGWSWASYGDVCLLCLLHLWATTNL